MRYLHRDAYQDCPGPLLLPFCGGGLLRIPPDLLATCGSVWREGLSANGTPWMLRSFYRIDVDLLSEHFFHISHLQVSNVSVGHIPTIVISYVRDIVIAEC